MRVTHESEKEEAIGGEGGGGERRKERKRKGASGASQVSVADGWGIRGRGALFLGPPFGGDGSEERKSCRLL